MKNRPRQKTGRHRKNEKYTYPKQKNPKYATAGIHNSGEYEYNMGTRSVSFTARNSIIERCTETGADKLRARSSNKLYR